MDFLDGSGLWVTTEGAAAGGPTALRKIITVDNVTDITTVLGELILWPLLWLWNRG